MSIDQEIIIEDLSTEKKFFSQIPNIITRMGLGPHAMAYYLVLKSVAGEKSCFMKVKTLAELVGCSKRQIQKMNKILSSPFEILSGKPLIRITYRKDKNGENQPNLIQLVDIWVENVDALRKGVATSADEINKKSEIKEKISGEHGALGGEHGALGGEHGASIIRTIEEDEFKKNDIVPNDRSLHKCDSIVSFDPETYRLPDGKPLSIQMKRCIAKYSPENLQKLRANVIYFEDQVKKGVIPNTTFERMLQACIKYNYAGKKENESQNLLYARWVKEEFKLNGLQILKTVVKFKRSDNESCESVSLSLPENSFCAALEQYIQKNKE